MINHFIDLRSDTVTHPTPEMRQAMAQAEVGDDVMGEDPTVNRLEELAAEKMGKEAGLFVPSGTMGNLTAILTHCGRGDEMIVGHLSHTYLFEAGGSAALGGVHPFVLQNQPDGTLRLEDLRHAVREDDPHYPTTRLIILENTHNRCGGVVLTPEYMRAVGTFAREKGLKLHVDGARIFNAAVALGVLAVDLVRDADSVTFCLSKGLCAPVGSVLCGSREFIARARRIRKQLGGGMRQAGILAAAGIVALEKMVERLAEDHRRARRLAEGLSSVKGLVVENPQPATNMVYVRLGDMVQQDAPQVAEELEKLGIKSHWVDSRRFRLVTHYWVNDEDISRTIHAFAQVLR
ncbi:low-specificity L-threonine aldolase [Anaerolinea thermophila]|uniref:Threonine aldolase n=1 Tax=Anaerolinea thermophila (strain DSM 14523 / JCM 11388 / NBRC 100420 / UNI-1) TaxID=926569 RepID=E8N3K1_ANATU|nr:low-specificity L-threonine aldolase [Anaerolinea thermophila]BAJ63015.1 threonine aldolase [Anaerolinea thermophila UNI-1]